MITAPRTFLCIKVNLGKNAYAMHYVVTLQLFYGCSRLTAAT